MPDDKKEIDKPVDKKQKKKRSLFRRIINGFLYFLLGILALILIALGITQTSTFREYLRETVIEEANAALNGTLNIEKIDGTILTSLILRNTTLNMEKDTILRAELISVKTSPLQILFKRIKIREFVISNSTISLIEDSNGILNIANLFKPTEPDTTTPSKFPYTIDVAAFELKNVDFSFQRYDYAGSDNFYDSLNMNDLRIMNLNVALSAFVDIGENEYELELNSFSLGSNIYGVELKDLTGEFILNQDEAVVNDLRFQTNNSDAGFSVELRNFNLFDSTAMDNIGEAIISAELNVGEFSFADLVPFMPAMKDMKGTIASEAEVSGTVNNLLLDKFEARYYNTQIAARGSVKNLMDPDAMFISAEFYDTYINPLDLKNIMPDLEIPGAKELGILRFDKLTYDGSLQKFKTDLVLKTDKGILSAKGNLNMESPVLAYNFNLQTQNLDISPFAGVSSNLNIRAAVEGRGTTPEELNARINLVGDGSVIEGNRLDTLRFVVNAQNRLIDYDLLTASDSMGIDIEGNIDFADSDNPAYVLDGSVRKLNLAAFTKDTSSESSLNFLISAEGENFDPELMNLYLSLLLYESTISGITIDTARAITDLRRDEGGQRVINFISDLADITLIGNFSVPKTIDLIVNEADALNNIISSKLNEIMPSLAVQTAVASAPVRKNNVKAVSYTDSVTSISYLVEFKDFDLISLFLGNNRLEVDGEISGEIRNAGDSLDVTVNIYSEYIKFWGADDIFFVSNLNLDLSLANKVDATSLDDVNAGMRLTTDRIFAGSDIHNLTFDLELKNNNAELDFSAQLENIASARLHGGIDMSGNILAVMFDTLKLNYNNYELVNDTTIDVIYSEAGIDIRSFVLAKNGGNISIKGTLAEKGDQNINISINNLDGNDIAQNLLQTGQATFNALINLNADISGNFASPVMDLVLNVDSVKYKDQNFGSLVANLDYKNSDLAIDIKFIDSAITANQPALQIEGNVPVNMALTGVEERFSESEEMNITLKADNFNLGAIGDILPFINRLRGNLAADLKLAGTPENLRPSGNVRLNDAAFVVEMNNLEYFAGMSLTVTPENLSLDSLMIKNNPETQNGGTMSGGGKASLDNLNITSSNFSISGDLKVLDDISKSSSPYAYGSLVIGTKGNIEFTMDEEKTFLKAPIVIKIADLTFPPSQSAYQNTSANFIYRYIEDTTSVEGVGLDFESLINLSKERSAQQQSATSKETAFDFSIDIEVEDEATIIFVLSKEFNQNLTAVLSGNMTYEVIGGRPNAQGELKLLDGSTLEFLKTLEADGSIRFESELTDPYLNITATYLDYYYEVSNGNEDDPEEIPVAVKIKIKGLLSELDKNFIKDENNIAVYYGQENINNNTPDVDKDASDAVFFILTGSFVDDASASTNTSFASSQAASLAGSLVGGFLNQQLGDYVRSVEVRQVGQKTKFNLSGRVNKFRYSIGGTTDVFQDLSQANVKIEYPLIESLLIRLERKQSITETSITNEMINELGLRYRFEF